MKKTTPLIKGVITGLAMVAAMLLLYYLRQPVGSGGRILIYALYAGGIAWTLLEYYRSEEYQPKFGEIFAKGFRCFIMVIVILVAFVVVFNLAHPEFAEESAKLMREELVKTKRFTPDQVDSQVAAFKKQYIVQLIYPTILGYLIIGSIFTAAGAGLLLMRRK